MNTPSSYCSTFYTQSYPRWLRCSSIRPCYWWPVGVPLCSLEAAVQARRNGPSLSSAPGYKISHRLLCACVWSTRSAASYDLPGVVNSLFHVIAAARFVTFGSRAFSFAAPTVWNSLPDDLLDLDSEHLMQNLKTHLLNGYFSERLAYYKCLTCTVEQDSKAKALTAAQKLKNYTITTQRTKIKIQSNIVRKINSVNAKLEPG